MRNRIEIQEGQKFGKWTYLKDLDSIIVSNKKVRMVLCKCDCGEERSVSLSNLRNGNSISCGCVQKQVTKERQYFHGGRKNGSEYTTWQGMKGRCYNPKHNSYKNYGGRGIKVCDRWLEYGKGFLNFINDLGKKPTPNHTLDRIDGTKDYSKDNCRWETRSIQNKNRRTYSRRKKIIE
jgi:hypothetical protein